MNLLNINMNGFDEERYRMVEFHWIPESNPYVQLLFRSLISRLGGGSPYIGNYTMHNYFAIYKTWYTTEDVKNFGSKTILDTLVSL